MPRNYWGENKLPAVETALIRVGSSVAVSIAKAWLKDRSGGHLDTASLLRILDERIGDAWDRRRARRQFDRLAEEVAKRLVQFVDIEYGSMPENEQLAAIEAVADTFEVSPVELPRLLRVDMDAAQLLRDLLDATTAKNFTGLLSPAGVMLYNRLLQECCTFAVQLGSSLPEFMSAASSEMLARESAVEAIAREVLDELPTAGFALQINADIDFDTQYRREISLRLDQLELFGLSNVNETSRRYKLSIAYITLSVAALGRAAAAESQALTDDAEVEAEDVVRVDTLLQQSNRIMIRGEAGSGKTTLMQWIAVSAARSKFKETLQDWNEYQPVLIRLRQYADRDLPAPHEFVNEVAKNVVGAMPSGWINRKLQEGQCILLIDGVDELPAAKRRKTKAWLRGLTESFPNCRFIVTSRPPAAAERWLDDLGFATADLLPMEMSDISAFIDHWHLAACEGLGEEERGELNEFQIRLLKRIRHTSSLRALATTPLLCAMLCALNRERRTQLPEDRMELYRTALEMLVDRRDIEREIASDINFRFSLSEKHILLQDIAYWLILNGRSDAERAEVEARIETKLLSMPRVKATSAEVFEYLLVRSGLLREPVAGRIDFIHRTFQEYLAAKQAVDDNHIDVIVKNAHDDQWREVVIVSAGHCSRIQRSRLLKGLINRGNVEARQRHRLHLLAVACQETSVELQPDLTRSLNSLLHQLVPPRNMTEAKAVASAGEVAAPLLAGHHRARAATVAACVRALGLIGGRESLASLSGYGPDGRRIVVRELLRAWNSFEPKEFAQDVLAEATLGDGHLIVSDPHLLPAIPELKAIRRVSIDISSRAITLDSIATIANLYALDASENPLVNDLHELSNFEGLVDLDLSSTQVSDLAPLSSLHRMRTLNLTNCAYVQEISPLEQLVMMNSLTLWATAVNDLSPLRTLTKLTRLDLDSTKVESLDSLAHLNSLLALDISQLTLESVDVFAQLERLLTLTAVGTSARSWRGLQQLRAIRRLEMAGSNVEFLPLIEPIPTLESLNLAGSAIRKLPNLEYIPNLRILDISACVNLADLRPLYALRGVRIFLDPGRVTEPLPKSFVENNTLLSARSRPGGAVAPRSGS